MKTTKQRFVAAIAALILALSSAFAQTIQIGNLQIPVANIQLVDTNSISLDFGTFYLLKDALDYGGSGAAPCPDDCAPGFQVYSLGIDGIFLVDNTGITDQTIQQILTPLFIIPDPNAPGAPPINWPVSLDGLPLVDPTNVPEFGTFYLYQDQFATDPPDPPPYPAVPDFAQGAPVYALDTNWQYLIDDTGITRPDPGPMPDYASPNYGTNLALYITGVSNYAAYLVLTNTLPGTNYDVWSKETLSDAMWAYEGTIAGASNQNWTPFYVPLATMSDSHFFWASVHVDQVESGLWLEIPTNGLSVPGQLLVTIHGMIQGLSYEVITNSDLTVPAALWTVQQSISDAATDSLTVQVPMNGGNLFVLVRYAASSQDIGLPDWWQMAYLGHLGVDPYALDPSGDGYSYLDDFLNGFVPGTYHTPRPPQNLSASLDSTGANVLLNWASGGGPVDHYVIERGDYYDPDSYFQAIGQVGSNNLDFVDSPGFNFVGTPYIAPAYFVRAVFVDSSYQDSQHVNVYPSSLYIPMSVVRGAGGLLYLVMPAVPANLSYVRLFWQNYALGYPSFDVAASNLVNGVAALPADQISGYPLWAQAFTTDGKMGEIVYVGPFISEDGPWSRSSGINFFADARSNLTENLKFLLRSATVTQPFSYSFGGTDPYQSFGRVASPLSYEYYGFHLFSSTKNCSVMNELRPIQENLLWRNFVFDPSDFDSSGTFDTGAGFDVNNWMRTLANPTYQYGGSGTETPLPLAFTAQSFPWVFFSPADNSPYDANIDPEVGITLDSNTNLDLAGSVLNCYGLPLNSLEIGETQLQQPGSVFSPVSDVYFPDFVLPAWTTVSYYFVSQSPYFAFYADFGDYGTNYPAPPLPGSPTFSVTNTSPLLITSVGQRITVSAWAEKKLLNSYQTYACLEQYFDKAYKVDTNGNVTANQTGVLSPYGEFLPTEPGPMALVTLPDIETGQQGTGIVQVISLNVDGNHDGVMDFTYWGPDQTTPNHPYRFWINDDSDSWDDGGDGVPGQGSNADALQETSMDDYRGFVEYGIRGTRDLVDWFPVYLNIGSLVKVLPSGPNIKYILKQADQAVNFAYTDLHPTNFMAYLTNTSVAESIVTNGGIVVTAQGTILDGGFIQKIATNGEGIILVEGVRPTTQPLVLEVWQGSGLIDMIWQGTNLLARTSLYLSLSGVEQMFRHKNLILNQTPNDPGAPADRLNDSDVPNEPDNNGMNFVFLHGYNVNPYQARGAFADVFKRLYWSGSHARFYGVTWAGAVSQGNTCFPGTTTRIPGMGGITPNYHTNVFNALQTAPLFASFIASLTNGSTVVAAHSLGNMVVLGAINDYAAPVGKYFMIDAAVATEALQGYLGQNAGTIFNMIYSPWIPYANKLYATYWCNLFSSSDDRSTLTWSNHLSNFDAADTYNFFSSGEEVLRAYGGDPPTNVVSAGGKQLAAYILSHAPIGSYVWVWQEKGKGIGSDDNLIGSTHGGWKFNSGYFTNGQPIPPSQASALPSSQLQTNAFFDVTSSSFGNADLALFGSGGSGYAQANRDRILSDALPALTLPVGSSYVSILGATHNFDMQALYENGWPSDRPQRHVGAVAPGEWLHSDFRQVAYPFTYQLFNTFVNIGNLK